MLTLLKQARAFGVGLVLATQNPVDLDYKGLSNCGTWFLGRLQTERDKARVLDGLEGASAQAGAQFDRQAMDKLLSALGGRMFLMNNVHENAAGRVSDTLGHVLPARSADARSDSRVDRRIDRPPPARSSQTKLPATAAAEVPRVALRRRSGPGRSGRAARRCATLCPATSAAAGGRAHRLSTSTVGERPPALRPRSVSGRPLGRTATAVRGGAGTG